MSNVYVLMKHPPHPYNAGNHLAAGEIQGIYSEKAEPQRIADEKNARNPKYHWAIHKKTVK